MKISILKKQTAEEPEVVILCRRQDPLIQDLARHIRQFSASLPAYQEETQYHIPLRDIYYLESVEGKTFLYTSDRTYTVRTSLTQLEALLTQHSFARVSRQCLVNIHHMNSTAPYHNHRLLITLKNGEKLLAGRTYIQSLKEKIHKEVLKI